LASSKGLKVKVKNPSRFHFEPEELLANLVNVYTNMAHLQTFKDMVVSDARSYSDETFTKAVAILARGKVGVDQQAQVRFEQLTKELASLY
jgi:ubiquitin conjugation factor E4 B